MAQRVESGKEAVCEAALRFVFEEDAWLRERIDQATFARPFVIGIGSGTTIAPLVRRLAERTAERGATLVCIPTSEQSRRLLLATPGFARIGTLDEFPTVHVTIDGADAVDVTRGVVIKGGGAAHWQEKMVAEASERYVVVVADSGKMNSLTNVTVPVEVHPLAAVAVLRRLQAEFAHQLWHATLRQSGSGKIGPVVTDNGLLVLDLRLDARLFDDARELDCRIRQFAGVVETGIFWRLPSDTVILVSDGNGVEGVRKCKLIK